jgi:hypothetical protein
VKQVGVPASPVQATLDAQQAAAARRAMTRAMPAVEMPPLQLLPETGTRWTDLGRAVRSAGSDGDASVHYAVVDEQIGDTRAEFHVKTIEGFPAAVIATRDGTAIELAVIAGPYPELEASKQAAMHIQSAIREALRVWGRKAELPAPVTSLP